MSLQLPIGAVTIKTEPVPLKVVQPDFKTLAQLEAEYIESALIKFENNKARTAQALGVTVKTLYNKLHAYGLFDKYASAK